MKRLSIAKQFDRNRKIYRTCVKTLATAHAKLDNPYTRHLLKVALEALLPPPEFDTDKLRRLAARCKKGK